jgi:hypothetical protein
VPWPQTDPPIDAVLSADVLPILIERMSSAPTAIQFEALWYLPVQHTASVQQQQQQQQ